MRLGKLLSLGSIQTFTQKGAAKIYLCGKISSLLKDENEWGQMLNLTVQDGFSEDSVQDRSLQKLLKEKLYYWLLQKAHVRGRQVRKTYKKIIRSVRILDKVILHWRRKGRGLSSFKPVALTAGTSMQVTQPKKDDYDFLKEGRNQMEETVQKTLIQYPEAPDRYRRLLNVVSELKLGLFYNLSVLNDHLNFLKMITLATA
ncbi:Hypothetical predicted protein [Olea europaea subsp. europaea]|uniref:Uncharacterized protein n=1 Tax=Olea europaea subsp. europaea TaxID=158383 RepID=A0A8S0VK15_OLEEU|nr:Hypothetical predicted protein [Olea europaea subsp. europaea]